MNPELEESSFRDRDGFVFFENGRVFRALHNSYLKTWTDLKGSGLLTELVHEKKIPSFTEVTTPVLNFENIALTLEVERLNFISYPGEWTFRQLKRAALITLEIQLKALDKGFSLKDASAYNVQFNGSQPLFIDLFSFESYSPDSPWVAYRQFCRHFLAPLLMLYYGIPKVQSLFVANIDGIPLDLCSKMLPLKSRLNLIAATHIHLHAKFESNHAADKTSTEKNLKLSKARLVAMLTHLQQGIKSLKLKESTTNWTEYYKEFSYSDQGFESKKEFVRKALQESDFKMVLDLGSNTGEFSMIALEFCKNVVACDFDERVVDLLQKKKINNVLPLCIDLSNPTPSYGWNSNERKSFISRAAEADMVFALALVHHLCIGNNVPLNKLSEFFSVFQKMIIIEFVPKDDVQVKKLLVTKKDIFDDYTLDNFKNAFSKYFLVEKELPLPGSDRVIFLMKRNQV